MEMAGLVLVSCRFFFLACLSTSGRGSSFLGCGGCGAVLYRPGEVKSGQGRAGQVGERGLARPRLEASLYDAKGRCMARGRWSLGLMLALSSCCA